VRVSHLFDGDDLENVRDMIDKGRKVTSRGEQHWKHKLTANDVRTVRSRLTRGDTQTAIALDFGVLPAAIWKIAAGRAWRSVSNG